MQDPSYGVAQPLQNHVHLISGNRFPMLQQLSLEQAFRYLLDAPSIVSKTAPMAWMYVQAPQDGTVWLEWISPRNGEYRFPSDGYIWGDPETTYRQEFGGYTIELMIHTVGYRPGHDHHATHARTRYHLIAKNPAVNAATPDPSLWIVHYHHTDPQRIIPSPQVPISPPMRQTLGERKQLEAQGRIERRDFMLHDREHWPTITLPGNRMQQQAYYESQNVNAPQNRFPQMPGYSQSQGPPNKRPRYSGPNAMPGASESILDTSIEDEENIALGDFFDHLTPREISMARYMQHHQWIEEVFSSPYASSQIVPADLGLGLIGELKGLTEGILDPPSMDEINRIVNKPLKPKEAQPFTNLKADQIEEFNRRVDQHLKEGQAEIEKMKEEHNAKMAEWKKSKGIMEAEKRLRLATWEGHEAALPLYRLDEPAVNGKAEVGGPKETIENVVSDVEALLGRKISSHQDASMIQRGGLEEEEPPKDEIMQDNEEDHQPTSSSLLPEGTVNGDLQAPSVNSGHSGMARGVGQTEPQPAQQQSPPTGQQQATEQPGQPTNIMDDGGLEDTSMVDNMDLDVDTALDLEGVDFGDVDQGVEDVGITNEPPSLPAVSAPTEPNKAEPAIAEPSTVASVDAAPGQPAPTSEVPQAQQVEAPQPVVASAEAAPEASEPLTFDTTVANDSVDDGGMFDDNTFADLADMDGGGDDGLVDFDDGMGLDDSAFGDAMHGMDAVEPSPAAQQGNEAGEQDASEAV